MSFVKVNADYEAWLRTQCEVVPEGLAAKHERMAKSPFDFLRATYFRWAATIEGLCPDLVRTAALTTVGDLHVENFGTWRDAEGRLVWGINDFDEAALMPFGFDLVRLATSARLASQNLLSHREAAEAILDGYRRGLGAPRPTLLDEDETWMREHVVCSDRKRARFWTGIEACPTCPEGTVPAAAERELRASLPPGATVMRFATRQTGGGSLGRPRVLAVAAWRGGRVVREAKAFVASAWDMAHGRTAPTTCFADLSLALYRSPDPFLAVRDGFIVRRIAPDARKVEFGTVFDLELHHRLLAAMGFELASVQSGMIPAQRILHDLDRLPPDWLHRASRAAAAAVEVDYKDWRAHWHRQGPTT